MSEYNIIDDINLNSQYIDKTHRGVPIIASCLTMVLLPDDLDNVLHRHEDPGEVSVGAILPQQLLCQGDPLHTTVESVFG